MKKRRLFWQLLPVQIFLALVALMTLTIWSFKTFKNVFYKQVEQSLEERSHYLTDLFLGPVERQEWAEIQGKAETLGSRSNTRITVLLPSGQVIGDTFESPQNMDNHKDRPEVRQAMKGQIGKSIRYSHTIGKDLVYLALPLKKESQILGILRLSVPIKVLDVAMDNLYFQVFLVLVVLILIVFITAHYFSRRMARPLELMKLQAEKYSQSNFREKIKSMPDSPEEVEYLGMAMNKMADELNERFQSVLKERNEKEAVFSSMSEGVLSVDNEGRILHFNQAAVGLFGVDLNRSKGHSLAEVVRSSAIIDMMEKAMKSEVKVVEEIIWSVDGEKEKFLQVHGTNIYDEEKQKLGTLLVFHDVTKIRELENHRKEFVANVSHELRTPLTSIKGFVETLLDGAMESAEEREHFLKIVLRHVNRLNILIEDLLTLSQLEKDLSSNEAKFELHKVRDVLESAVSTFELRAKQKNIHFDIDCSPQLATMFHYSLVEMAVINLIDNALKFSKDGDHIQIGALENSGLIQISVSDHGPGISEAHQERIFERFYRVDKSRGSKVGGTGLGLSIVKHIALFHRGRAEVKSKEGAGSTFCLYIPKT